jgi:indole-3-glycerol phosphate synthase
MDRIAASREEAQRLRGQAVSEVTPSRRNFAQYVAGSKDEPQVIARLTRAGTALTRDQLVDLAVACDDAEVAALAVALLGDLSPDDLAAISATSTAPILRLEPLVDVNQLYHSRLHGADAVVLPADALDRGELERLVDVAVSMHVGVIVECSSAAAVEAALRWPHTILGFREQATAAALARQAPATRTVVLLEDVGTRAAYDAARGNCDAVVIAADDIMRQWS